MSPQEEQPKWRAYQTANRDGFGYESVRFGVREEYADGATRNIHNETYETREEAEQVAALFHLNSKKGKSYDNVMKRWR